jgi:hypothetical protein
MAIELASQVVVVSFGQNDAARMQTDLVQHARKVDDAAHHVIRTAGQLFFHRVISIQG